MNFSYENQGENTYLVYALGENEQVETVGLKMITYNKIPGLAATLFTQMDTTRYLKYNITSKVTLSQYFSGMVTKKRLLGVFEGILEAVSSLDEYLIDVNSLLFETDRIFVNIASGDISMICLPTERDATADLGMFFRNIVCSVQFDPNEGGNYVMRLFNYLNTASGSFSISDFKALIEQLSQDNAPASAPVYTAPAPEAAPVQPEPAPVYTAPVQPEPQPAPAPVQPEQPAIPQAPVYAVKKPISTPEMPPVIPEEPKKKGGFSLFGGKKDKDNTPKPEKVKPEKQDKKKDKNSAVEIPTAFAIPGQETHISNVAEQMNAPTVEENQPSPAYTPTVTTYEVAPSAPVYAENATVFSAFDDSDEDEGTVIMGAEQTSSNVPYLMRRKNGERISINKPEFRIGRNSDLNDYNVTENNHIGHSHCHIISSDEGYFIVDDNSRNHTFVDGKMIASGVSVNILHGQTIRLADEEFEFRLY